MDEGKQEKSVAKRKREESDTGGAVEGSREKESDGQVVPALPRSEGGSGSAKKGRCRARPFPELSPSTAYERLSEYLVNTVDEDSMKNKEDVMRKVDELVYLAEDLSKGCHALGRLVSMLDLKWQMKDSQRLFDFSAEAGDVFSNLPYVAKWLIDIDSWDMVLTHLLNKMDIHEIDLVHDGVPNVESHQWRKLVIMLLKKLHFLWKRHAEFPDPPPTYTTNWIEI